MLMLTSDTEWHLTHSMHFNMASNHLTYVSLSCGMILFLNTHPPGHGLILGLMCCSQVVKGLVFKKRAAHKHMPTSYKNPRLLLIRGELGQFSSGLSSFASIEQQVK